MSDKLLSALGIPGAPESTRAKILKDNFFYNKCLEALVESIAPSVADRLHSLERDALVRRYLSAPKPEIQPGRVTWEVGKSDGGEWYILATGPRKDMGEGKSYPSGQTRFIGPPARAIGFRFMGESVPPEILAEYEQMYVPLYAVSQQETKF